MSKANFTFALRLATRRIARRLATSAVAGAALLTLVACGASSPTAPAASPTTAATTVDAPLFTKGSWTVTQLSQRSEDKTSQLAGYVFTFTKTSDESGTVVASRNGSSVSGSWSHRPAVNYYGATSTEAIVLSFGASSAFARISKLWNVGSITASTMSLDNPELAEDEHLVFSKQ
jgi:hypothetical protein